MNTANDYVIQFHADPTSIDASQWDAMLELQDVPTPFMRHDYLCALHASGSAIAENGWSAQWLTLSRHGVLQAACALYLKGHSWGEYVFDWAWADAYQRHGLAYYPKLLAAVPFTPVPGSRLLALDEPARDALLQSALALARRLQLSSLHLLFLSDADRLACQRAGLLLREGVQFHWQNRSPLPYADFADFLASLHRDKRKKIAQERRRVADAGVSLQTLEGEAIDSASWDFFYRCYTLTYRAHRSTPYLSRSFFGDSTRRPPAQWLMVTAWRGGERIAASLVALDRQRGVAYGRYWGATESVPCLHFEACYYQPLAWCIAHGYRRFEGGAQGEHKMARGLLPVKTASAHWLADQRFASAVADFLQREGADVEAYVDELRERNPFRQA